MSGSVQQLDQVRDTPTAPDQRRGDRPRGRFIYRHTALVRATHWINVVFLTILLMSGLQIFNAHPALYWGEVSNFGDPVLSVTAQRTEGSASRGITTVAGHQFDTTGWLGLSKDATGRSAARAFPTWATLPSWPSLAEGRLWHFFFAWLFVLNGLVYLLFGLLNLHLWRDMVPSLQELRGIVRSAWDHLRLRFPTGEEATRYNVIQKLSYLVLVLVLLPILVLAGLAKATITIFLDCPLSSFCKTEKSVVPSSAGITTSPSMIADPAFMCQASVAIFRKRLVQSLPRRVNTLTAASLRWTWTR